MSVVIKVRKDGPYLVEGEFTLIDHEGNPIPYSIKPGKTGLSLCRCGASTKKPFCDGTHSKIGFRGAEEAAKEFDASTATSGEKPSGGGTGA